jgi:hypothetical protein
MVIPSIAMFITPPGTLDPPLLHIYMPHISKLWHSPAREARNSAAVALNDPRTSILPATTFTEMLKTLVTKTTWFPLTL